MTKTVDTVSNKVYTVLVWNALDGGIPLEIRKRRPDARIICGEYFTEHVDFLRNRLGFEVVMYNEIDDKIMAEIDVVVGNPPFQATKEDGERKDQASNLWSKFWGKSFNIVKEDGVIALITPTSWLSPSADFKNSREHVEDCDRLWDVFNKYSSYADVDNVGKHFPGVGSTFGYVIVNKAGDKGLSFSDGATTQLGFRPRGNVTEVSRQLSHVDNLDSRFTINQNNTPDLRVSLPLTRTLDQSSIEILSGVSKPTAGSDDAALYLYIHVGTQAEAEHVQARIRECTGILNVDCKWSGFVNIRVVRMIRWVV